MGPETREDVYTPTNNEINRSETNGQFIRIKKL